MSQVFVDIPVCDGSLPFAFISYSHHDILRIAPILKILRKTCRFWYDEGLKIGTERMEEIGRRIYDCDLFLVFLSEHAMSSHYMKDEIHYAHKFAKKMMAVFLEPVHLDRSFELILSRFQYVECFASDSDAENAAKILQGMPASIEITQLSEGEATVAPGASAPDQAGKTVPPEPYSEPLPPGPQPSPVVSSADFRSLYETGRLIGRGGSGKVYAVRSIRTGAEYVMKHQHFASGDSPQKRLRKAVARNELQKLLLLQNKPYTPVLVDYLETEVDSCLIMSRIDGLNLRDVVKRYRGILSMETAVSLIREVARILQDLHKMELVYGDVKPSNLILNPYGQIYMIDFGSACSLSDPNYLKTLTPRYSAPEQRSPVSSRPDFRFDVYALGVFFRELVAGTPYSLRAPDSQDLEEVCARIYTKMTAPAPGNRYDTMGEVCAALELVCPENSPELLRRFTNSIDQWDPVSTGEDMDREEETDQGTAAGGGDTLRPDAEGTDMIFACDGARPEFTYDRSIVLYS